MSKKKGKLIYFGKYLKANNSIEHIYYEVNDKNEIGDKWRFSKSLFKKGRIGSVYDCEFENSTVVYNKNDIPTSMLKASGNAFKDTFILFPQLYKAEEQTRQIDIKIRNSKKPDSLLDVQIDKIRDIYKSLSPQSRSSFIANIVYKITK